MSVDARMQIFYRKGYQSALADMNNFMERVGINFSHLRFNDRITAKDFLATVMTQFNSSHGYNPPIETKDNINGK